MVSLVCQCLALLVVCKIPNQGEVPLDLWIEESFSGVIPCPLSTMVIRPFSISANASIAVASPSTPRLNSIHLLSGLTILEQSVVYFRDSRDDDGGG